MRKTGKLIGEDGPERARGRLRKEATSLLSQFTALGAAPVPVEQVFQLVYTLAVRADVHLRDLVPGSFTLLVDRLAESQDVTGAEAAGAMENLLTAVG